jgi:hypothetical protein
MDQPVVPGFHLTHLLGTGASGTVWAATRDRDGAGVALKVVPVGGAPVEADHVARELAVLGRVRAEGLVGFHDAFGLPSDPPSVAIVLDRVEGGSLVSVLAARGRLSVGEAVTVLTPVARTLAGLHAAGVVHGDVSPPNVLFERTGRPLLADLGVARLVGQEPGEVYGTDGFVAPEVGLGAVPGQAADVYAVGALAWCCVTGAPPDPPALRRSLAELAGGLPEAWLEVVSRCLAADPAERPSAAEAALLFFDAAPCEALQLVVAGDEASLLTRRICSGAPAPPSTPEGGRRWRLRRRRPRPLRVVAACGVAVVTAVGAATAGGLALAESWSPHPSAPFGAASRSSVAPPADPVRDRSSPTADARALMGALAQRRAAAMNSGTVADLSEVDAPGSPALSSDAALLGQLSSAGQRYEGVSLTVRSARLVRRNAATATVRAAVDTSAYRLVAASGRSEERPAAKGEELSFDLVWAQNGWRVSRVTGGGG